jgi:hypothetical protein
MISGVFAFGRATCIAMQETKERKMFMLLSMQENQFTTIVLA